MMVWIHDTRSDSDVMVNTDYISSVERDQFDAAAFHVRMVNHDIYTIRDEDGAAWLTMQQS